MLSLFSWNDTFLTHLDKVDAQHQTLVKLINDLGEMVLSPKEASPTELAALRDRIYSYGQRHFQDEDDLMRAERVDPRHVSHHQENHAAFVAEAQLLGTQEGLLPSEQAKALTEYLVHWLAFHILGEDQSMARQIHAIREGQSPAAAYEAEQALSQKNNEPLLNAMSGLFYVVTQRNRELRELNQLLESKVKQRTRELERANARLEELSTHDELTGLPNRRYAMLQLEQLWLEYKRYGTPVCILFIDADRFKTVNDRYGHAQGDALLRLLAKRLQQHVRASDISCRLGGDEFLVICHHCKKEGALAVAQKIRDSATLFLNHDGAICWDGSVSIGIAESDDDMLSVEDLLKAADLAMYDDKLSHRKAKHVA